MFSAHGVAPSVHANARAARASDDRRHLSARDEGARRGEEVRRRRLHDRARRSRRARGGRGDDGGGPGAHRPDRERSRTSTRSRSRTRARSPTSPRRRCRSTRRGRSSRACASASRRSSGPRTDDICYATTNRQAAVKQLARQCDLVLVIGSRNSSNSNRLVEVAREHGADSHLIDNEGAGAGGRGWRASGWSGSPPARALPRSWSSGWSISSALAGPSRRAGSSRSSRRTSASCCPRRSARPAAASARRRDGSRCARWSSPTCIWGRTRGATCCAAREPRERAARRALGASIGSCCSATWSSCATARSAMRSARPRRCSPRSARRSAPAREVVIVPGNHDHQLLERLVRAARTRRSAGAARARDHGRLATTARRSRSRAACLGAVGRPRRATPACGCATTCTRLTATTATGTRPCRCSSGSAPARWPGSSASPPAARSGSRTTRRSSPPIYAWIHAIAQNAGDDRDIRPPLSSHGASAQAWRALGRSDSRAGTRTSGSSGRSGLRRARRRALIAAFPLRCRSP